MLTLKRNLRISTEKMLDIVAAAVPFDKEDEQARAYWLAKCGKLLASVRDDEGRRMV